MVISLDTRAKNVKQYFYVKYVKGSLPWRMVCIPKFRIKVEVRSARKGVDTKN